MCKYQNIAFRIIVALLLFVLSSPSVLAQLTVDHTAWDIRTVGKIFDQNTDALKVVYTRDSVKNAGAFEIFSAKGLVKKESIVPGSSPLSLMVVTTYPKTYSRESIRNLLKWLENGDRGLTTAPHEVAGLNVRAGKVTYFAELTGANEAAKVPVDKLRVFRAENESDPGSKVELSGPENLKAGRLWIDRGNNGWAEEYLNRAREAKETKAAAASELAYLSMSKNDFEGCISWGTKAIEADRKMAMGWANRGACKSGISKFDDALDDLDRALELDGKLANAYMTRAGVHRAMRDCTKAKQDAAKAVALEPSLQATRSAILRGCN
jgi:hypothetical protein